MTETKYHKCDYLKKKEEEVAIGEFEGNWYISLRYIEMVDAKVIIRDIEYCPYCGVKLRKKEFKIYRKKVF